MRQARTRTRSPTQEHSSRRPSGFDVGLRGGVFCWPGRTVRASRPEHVPGARTVRRWSRCQCLFPHALELLIACIMSDRPRTEIAYCYQCKWDARAAWMAQEVPSTVADAVGEVALLPSTGGTHEIRANSHRVWSRAERGRFPQPKEVKQRLRDVVDPEGIWDTWMRSNARSPQISSCVHHSISDDVT